MEGTLRRPSLRWAAWCGACGAFLALALLGVLHYSAAHWALATHFRVLSVTDVVWPSSFWLLATDGDEYSFGSWVIVAESILANGVLYGAVGLVASVFLRRARAV